MAKCDGPNCDAEVVWAITPNRKRQPFNREPDAKGNRVLLGRGPDKPPLAIEAALIPVDLRAGCVYMPATPTVPTATNSRATARHSVARHW